MQNANNAFTEKRTEKSAKLPKTLPNKTKRLPKNMPKHMTEKTYSDNEKMIAKIISDQKILRQFAPKILSFLF